MLILDLDAHCGGGTAELIADEPRIWQQDVSVDEFDLYDSRERARLHLVHDSAAYLDQVATNLQAVDDGPVAFDLCLYNAGMDPYQFCATGGLAGLDLPLLAQREKMVFDWSRRRGLPLAFVLAGGYLGEKLDKPGLVALHRLTIMAAAQRAAGGAA